MTSPSEDTEPKLEEKSPVHFRLRCREGHYLPGSIRLIDGKRYLPMDPCGICGEHVVEADQPMWVHHVGWVDETPHRRPPAPEIKAPPGWEERGAPRVKQ